MYTRVLTGTTKKIGHFVAPFCHFPVTIDGSLTSLQLLAQHSFYLTLYHNCSTFTSASYSYSSQPEVVQASAIANLFTYTANHWQYSGFKSYPLVVSNPTYCLITCGLLSLMQQNGFPISDLTV